MLSSTIGCYRVLSAVIGCNRLLSIVIKCYRVLSCAIECNRMLWVLSTLIECYRVLSGLIECHYWVGMDRIRTDWQGVDTKRKGDSWGKGETLIPFSFKKTISIWSIWGNILHILMPRCTDVVVHWYCRSSYYCIYNIYTCKAIGLGHPHRKLTTTLLSCWCIKCNR